MGKSSTGMPANLAAFLAYFFILIGGIIFFFLEKSNSSVKFAAKQSILYGAVCLVLSLLFFIPVVGLIVNIIVWIGWILLWVTALMGKELSLPLIGNLAKSWSS